MQPTAEVTHLLRRWSGGKTDALDALIPLLYEELKSLGRFRMREEHRDHTFRATALVHEGNLRRVDIHEVQWNDRRHFLAMAARLMQRILSTMPNKNAPRNAEPERTGARPKSTIWCSSPMRVSRQVWTKPSTTRKSSIPARSRQSKGTTSGG